MSVSESERERKCERVGVSVSVSVSVSVEADMTLWAVGRPFSSVLALLEVVHATQKWSRHARTLNYK